MKYEVIGWASCYEDRYPFHDPITASVDAAIIKDIREHGYLFGGDRHEDYCPVLNDGTKASYSWRGWGRIIALAYGEEGEYSYMCGYMDSMIKPKARKYPDMRFPNDERIVPKEMLAEVLVMHLNDDMFEAVKAGTKTVEIRLFDEKRKHVDIGDYIDFRKASDETQHVLRKVTNIDLAETFERMFLKNYYADDKVLRYTPVALGSPEGTDCQSLVEGMYKIYTKEQEKKCGVISIELEKPKHCCTTCFAVWTDKELWGKRYSEKLDDPNLSDEEFLAIIRNEETFDRNVVADELGNVSENFEQLANWLRLGLNDNYSADINVMLRETLKELFGKEQLLKDIQDRRFVPMTLEVFVTVIKDSDEPKQNLTIDKDIKEFMKKAGVELRLKKRTV